MYLKKDMIFSETSFQQKPNAKYQKITFQKYFMKSRLSEVFCKLLISIILKVDRYVDIGDMESRKHNSFDFEFPFDFDSLYPDLIQLF